MNTTLLSLSEAFCELLKEAQVALNEGRTNDTIRIISSLVEITQKFIHRGEMVLGMQALAQKTANMYARDGHPIKPPSPPDTPPADTTGPLPPE